MLLEETYRKFNRNLVPRFKDSEEDFIILFTGGDILLNEETFYFPMRQELTEMDSDLGRLLFLGDMDGKNYYFGELIGEIDNSYNYKLKTLRSILSVVPRETFLICAMAYQIFCWDKSNKYCGKCGHELHYKSDERAKVCSNCDNVLYPRISPAMMVSITCDDKILLAHNKNFPTDMYGNISGFIDAGENLEACIFREVYEEIGIRIKNIKYFGSQVWPFPDSLMLGFTAEYDSGKINVDGEEIVDARWFDADNMPRIPEKNTIAYKMIQKFLCDK